MTITMRTEARSQCVASIERYAAEELDDVIGDLRAGLLLDFFLKEIGPVVYDAAVADAHGLLPAARRRSG